MVHKLSPDLHDLGLVSPIGLGSFWHGLRNCEVAKTYMPLKNQSPDELEQRLINSTIESASTLARERYFGVAANGEVVGIVGCNNIAVDLKYGEINYMVDKSYRNMGVGKSAVKLLVAHMFECGFTTLSAIIDIRNIASQRVAEFNGFERVEILSQHLPIQGTMRDQYRYQLRRS